MSAWWLREKELDEDQLAVFNLAPKGHNLILGPPGSGKTNLLLLKAEQLTRSGAAHLRVIVFNRTLQEFIRHGIGIRMVLPPSNIVTLVRFLQDILREHSVELEAVPATFDELRAALVKRVTELVVEESLDRTFSALLIDEVQDYTEEELALFKTLAKVVFAAGDVRQRISQVKVKLEAISAYFDAIHLLRHHYRNGQTICRLADAVMEGQPGYDPMLASCRYDEVSKPSTVVDYPKVPRLEDQCLVMVPDLLTQLRAYPGEPIGIISARTSDIDTIADLLRASPIGSKLLVQKPNVYQAFDSSRPIWLCALQSAKGLEFRAVHVLATDRIRHVANPRSKAYMAITRAKTSLCIHSADVRLGFLEDALYSLRDDAALPTSDDIFGDDPLEVPDAGDSGGSV